MNSFYTQKELFLLGLKSFGKKVLISRKCSIYSPAKISIGNNVRIDDFCILSGTITLGSNIHISAYCALYGGNNGILMEDYTGVSPRVTIYSSMDDFSGDYLIGPIHLEGTNVTGGVVILEKHVQIGSNSTIFPNLIIEEGSVVGAHSLVTKSLDMWSIYIGIPVVRLKGRKQGLLKFIK